MKYEIHDMIDEKYKYGLKILRIHNKIKHRQIIKTLLILPIYNKLVMNLFFIILNSMSTILLCSDFNYEENQSIYLTKYLNLLTPLGWVEKLSIDNTTYLIICGIFIFFCIIRSLYLIYITLRIKKIHITKIYNIKINQIINILNHIVYIFFTYIIQFLSFIIYIEIFPNTFTIKKKLSHEYINLIFIAINIIFIVIYNFYNYLFIQLAILPKNDEKISFQLRVPSLKFYIYLIFENLSLLQALPYCLGGQAAKIWNICFSLFIISVLILIYFISLKSFNYNNIINNVISFIGEFCFMSLITELILYFSKLTYTNYKQLISFTIIKIIMALCLYFLLDNIYGKLMIREVKRQLFNKDTNNYNFDKKLIGYILYLREIIMNDDPILIRAIRYFELHQQNCQNKYCSCKIIKFSKSEESDIDISLKNHKQQLIHFMDSILIQMDFNKSYDFSYVLSEHFYIFKNNYIMAYSILQTLLHNNHQNLSLTKTVYLYHTMEKYINAFIKAKLLKIDFSKDNQDQMASFEENKENELKKYFNPILKIKKINKLIIQYSTKKNELIKYKQDFESTIRVDMDETDGEVHMVVSPILNQGFITKIIDYLRYESTQTKDLKKLLYDLKEFKKILSLEFLFKCFLFIDYFWNAQIPHELVDILYGFTTNKNLYSTKISNKLYDILEKKYNDENYTTKYYILLKYTKSLIISYISESLIRKLKLSKENIKNKDLSTLIIKDIVNPHNKAVNQFFMSKQHFVIINRKTYFFNNKRYLITNRFSSTFQIGINKNILIVGQLQIDEENKTVKFLANKNMEIISINQYFENKFNLSLPLIEEFRIEIKDLFDVSKKLLFKKFKKEIKQIKKIRQFIQLDPKEYILKNIFKQKNTKETYKFNDENIFTIEKKEENDDNNDEDYNKLIKKKVKTSFIKMVHKIFNNQNMELFHKKSINFRINKDVIINKMKKMMERISVYEQGKLESKNLYKDFLRFNQNYASTNSRVGVYINLKVTMKLIYDTPVYICKIQQYENSILIKDVFYFWDNKLNIPNSEREIDLENSNSFINLKLEKSAKNILMDESLKNTDIYEGEKTREENLEIYPENNENLKEIRDKIKKKKISKSILRTILVTLILILLVMYIIILTKKLNLIKQADSIFKTLFYTYYQRAQLLYINSVVLSIHFNLVNLTGNETIKENRDMLRFLTENLEEGFHLFYSHYLDYKEGVNEDTEELYSKRTINKITINWENVRIDSDYIKEMQIILYYAMESSENKTFTKTDVDECEYFLLGQFIDNDEMNFKKELSGNLIRLIYYLYKNYDSEFESFFEDLTESFEDSFNKFSNETVLSFLLLETAGLLLYIIFFLINFYFLFQANKYIFQNILCLFLDFTQKDYYKFNNKNDNLLISKYIRNYISLLTEFTPKKLEALHTASFDNDLMTINDNKDELDETVFSEIKENDIEKKIKDKNDEIPKKKARSRSTLRSRFFLNQWNKSKKNMDAIEDNTNDIHDLNQSNLSKNLFKKLTNTKSNNATELINKSILTNNTTDKTQNNSSIMNININNSLIDQSKSNVSFNQNKNNISFQAEYENQNLKIEKIILSSKSIIIKIVKAILIIFVVLSILYVIFYIVSIIIGFIIIREIREMYEDFRVLVSQYNEIIHYWNNMKTLFILPNTTFKTDINIIEKHFSNLNTEVLNIISYRIQNYKRVKILYNYLFNAQSQEDLIKANFCKHFEKCFALVNSTQNVLLNGLNSAVALYAKEIYNYYQDYTKIKDNIKTKDDIKKNFIKDNFIILGTNINHIIGHIEEKFFEDFLADEKDIASSYHNEIQIFSLISLFYCIILNLYSLLIIFSYINQHIDFIESSTFRIVSSFCHIKYKIQSFLK